ncbi:MAG: hypothetical protein QOI40_2529 [Alphaproteobacteria bacterium]|jgi:hypothetical protein|nr:hypothetical protein [Alphaproteobacteria bacterium]
MMRIPETRSMQHDSPCCPVCTGTMIMRGASPLVHLGGTNDCTLRFVCEACRVETSRTVKGFAVATHASMMLPDRAA